MKLKAILVALGFSAIAMTTAHTGANAGAIIPAAQNHIGLASGTTHGSMGKDIHLIGNSFSQNRRDAANKFNPNADRIRRMLGGNNFDMMRHFFGTDVSGLYPSQHYAYCEWKYGSYRLGDNTFLSFSGERKQCRSPYSAGDN